MCGSYGPNKCSRPRTRDSQTGERRENRGEAPVEFFPSFFSWLSFSTFFLSLLPPRFPSLFTLVSKHLTHSLFIQERGIRQFFFPIYLSRRYLSLSLSPCLSFYVIENFPRYTRRCFQICLVEQEGKHRDIPGSHSEARAPISLTGLILRVYFPRSR